MIIRTDYFAFTFGHLWSFRGYFSIFFGVSEQGVHRVQVHLQFFGKEYKIFFEMLQLFDVYTSDTPELSRAKLKTFWAEPSQADQL